MSFLHSPFARRIAAMLSLLFVTSLTACNTIEGAGQDMQSGGRAVEDTADDAKN